MTPPTTFPTGRLAVIVTGGRGYLDVDTLIDALESLDVAVLIHGGADGADFLAGTWARHSNVRAVVFRAAWREHGRAAGPIRNGRMIAETVATIAPAYGATPVVVAFPGGRGTADCVRQAKAAGVPVWEVGS